MARRGTDVGGRFAVHDAAHKDGAEAVRRPLPPGGRIALFRQEVVSPTRFHAEFKKDFGKPVYDALRDLLAMAVSDAVQLELWTTSVWAQVSVYALADAKWHASFRPAGVSTRAWAEKVRDHICSQIFNSLSFNKKGAS